jgi:hypothetical protein
MPIRILFLSFLNVPFFLFAQVGVGTTTPHASARLQIDASASGNAKGFLPPRVTGTERNAISSPATGLIVYQTDAPIGFYFFNGSAWVRLITPSDNATNITGTVAVANGGTGLTSITSGQIPFGNGTSAIATDSKLEWDNSSSRLNVTGSTWFKTNGTNIGLIFDGYSPSGSLQVSRIYTEATSGTPSDFILGTYPNGHLNQLYLKQSNGFVGIRNSNPNTALDVNGTVNATSVVSPTITGGSGTTQALTYKPTTGVGATGADHIFQVGNNGGTEAMRILNSGNVGIGTNNPTARLDIRTSPTSTSDPGAGLLGVGSTSSSAASAGAGAIAYSTSSGGVLQYSNGTSWNTLSSTVQKANVYASRTGIAFPVNHNTTNSLDNFTTSSGTGNVSGTWNSTTGVYTAPRTGLYTISAGMSFLVTGTTSATGILHFLVMKNGLNGTESCNLALPVNYPANQNMSANISCSVPLNVGETLQIKYLQWSGSTVNIALDNSYEGRYYISVIEN